MANPFHHTLIIPLIFFILFLHFHYCHSLWTLQNLLSTINFTTINANSTTSYCTTTTTIATNLSPQDQNPSITLVCYENTITQLHISGNTHKFYDQNFTTDSLFSTISAIFPNLKVLTLTSLAINGPLPGAVLASGLSSLEILNISSNHFYGEIPFEISNLNNLQSLVFDHNSFTGQVPAWLGLKVKKLTFLSFKNNSLDGYLPKSLSHLGFLRVLDLSLNRLSGEVPNDFKNLTNLQILDLHGNQFGPRFPIVPNRLTVLVLKNNKFSYGIPSEELKTFYQLQKLDLSINEFNGPFAPSLFSLPSLTYLDISSNKFTGKLTENVSCGEELVFVDFSSNRLTGDLPSCMKRLDVSYGGNCLSNVEDKQQHNLSFCRNEAFAVNIVPSTDDSSKPNRKMVVVFSVVGGVIVGGVALFGVVFLAMRRECFDSGCSKPQLRMILEKVSPAYTIKMLTDARYISERMKLGALGIPTYRTFVLGELMEATNNFNTSSLMGNGSQGQLYKGQLSDGTMVAIRNMKMRKRCNIQSYTRQIELISKVRHSNLVNPIGHCFGCYSNDSNIVSSVFLVFEFIPNGNLRAFLSGGKKFSWAQRLAAAIGIAKGIQFLQTGIVPGIFSNNLKITDVLLDHSFHVKISNYNLPLLSQSQNQVGAASSVNGSKETLQERFKNEDIDHDDVYDLGVILLELIMGRVIGTVNDTIVAKDLLQVSLAADDKARRSIVDPSIYKECCEKSLKTLMELCVKCLSKDRPSIDDALWNLQFIAHAQESSMEDPMSDHASPEPKVVSISEYELYKFQ